MLVNFSIYISMSSFSELSRIIEIVLNAASIRNLFCHKPPLQSETFDKSQLSEPIDVPSGCNGKQDVTGLWHLTESSLMLLQSAMQIISENMHENIKRLCRCRQVLTRLLTPCV